MTRNRHPGPDAARGLAMVAMTCTHTLRVVAPHPRPALAENIMRLEPLIPALFCLCAGWALATAQSSSQNPGWLAKQAWRSAKLFAFSEILFFVKWGVQWPESITSTGILGCLGVSLLVAALVGNVAGNLALAAGLSTLWVWMDHSGLRIDGLNQGSFPLFPYLPFVLFAYGLTLLVKRKPMALCAVVALAVGLSIWSCFAPGFAALWGPWGMTTTSQMYQFTRVAQAEGFSLVWDLLNGKPTYPVMMNFWHTFPGLALFVGAWTTVVFFVVSWCAAKSPKIFAPLSLLGRHALPYYIGHLILLGPLFFLPPAWREAPWTWTACVATLVGCGVLFALFRERTPPKEAL